MYGMSISRASDCADLVLHSLPLPELLPGVNELVRVLAQVAPTLASGQPATFALALYTSVNRAMSRTYRMYNRKSPLPFCARKSCSSLSRSSILISPFGTPLTRAVMSRTFS